MQNEGWTNNTEVKIDNEDIYVCRQFCCRYPIGRRTKNHPQYDNPDNDYDALDNECRNRSFEKGVFGNSPELEMPAIDQRPEDDG